ncbi:diacylglycerol kinase family protein [Lutibacter sp.]|uniref:diacylglycerol/lipid kinase family protein n=1 Tax=Lutibacter sp. TaxID=1925666 RepID=UPI002734FE56|nr:diacylglycerol kinase family protein [Lutibacter sp.]MDP3313881.1 diacylglycerol kinase family lipid kinase [Lutibacter sp.]
MNTNWFVIINPKSGHGSAKKKWPLIKKELIIQNFDFEYEFTKHHNHAVELVKQAIIKEFTKFICVGGDGTIHHLVNGILHLNPSNKNELKIGVIPIGTGNDWIKTYKISKNYKKSIAIIKNENTISQDIGKIKIKESNKIIYFNNLAGIGFDGYVVNKVSKFKHLGFLAYLTGALVSLTSYNKSTLEIKFNNIIIKQKTLLFLIGLCKFSGGGMQLTKNANPTDSLFDITHVSKITLFTILSNLRGLFNGNLTNHKSVNNYKTSQLKIKVLDNQLTYIQADGELIGSGNFKVKLLPKAINFIVPKP